ncbi:hypothetical protein BV22DRAFT_1016023, partial [Leucogyrophana mollusca]
IFRDLAPFGTAEHKPFLSTLSPWSQRATIINNVLNIDAARPWPTYSAWAEKYGGIVYSSTFGQQIIIVSSFQIASALFEQRSPIYSNRIDATVYTL